MQGFRLRPRESTLVSRAVETSAAVWELRALPGARLNIFRKGGLSFWGRFGFWVACFGDLGGKGGWLANPQLLRMSCERQKEL